MTTPPDPPGTHSSSATWSLAGLSPAAVKALEQLTALHEGYAGVGAVLGCGSATIPPLTAILRHTETSGIFEIRARAVAALAGLGADSVLIDFIDADHPVDDPTARSGEEATISIAARALKASTDPRAFPALLKLARRRPLPGAIEALAASGREEAIPGLIPGLDEDDTRGAASKGLISLGRCSRNALLAVVAKPAETSSALRRRRVAVSALADIGVAAWQRVLLRPLIDNHDPEVSLHACRALMRSGTDIAACRARLQDLLPGLHAPLKEMAADLLAPPAGPLEAPAASAPRERRPLLHLKPAAEPTSPSAG